MFGFSLTLPKANLPRRFTFGRCDRSIMLSRMSETDSEFAFILAYVVGGLVSASKQCVIISKTSSLP